MTRRDYYRQAREAGYPAQQAWTMAHTRERWDAAEERGLVRLRVEPDDSFEPYGETARERAEVSAEVEREGAWGIIGEARCGCCGEWHAVDSVWAFVGKSWSWSGYDIDVMRAALAWLEEHSCV
jgi:hypothetical protein